MRLHWKTTLRLAPVVALTGGILLAAGSTLTGGSTPAAAQSELEYRVFGLQVACDSCVNAGPGTPTATATRTPTGTLTPGTATPTATATPSATVGSPTATATATTPAATATPTDNPDPTCSGAVAEITGLSKSTNPETVTVTGSGNLGGWYIISTNGGERFTFPQGFTLNGTVVIRSGSFASANPPSALLWTSDTVWADSANDDAYLFNCDDFYRSDFDDGLPNEESTDG